MKTAPSHRSPLRDEVNAGTENAASPDHRVESETAETFEDLERRLTRGNHRRQTRLQAWAELLDAAGWCVAIAEPEGKLWMGTRAQLDLSARGPVPTTWAALQARLESLPGDAVHIATASPLVWQSSASPPSQASPAAPLTRRETEVLDWLREGKTGPEIAIILGCARRTVENHIANLYRKLGVRDRAAAILNLPSA